MTERGGTVVLRDGIFDPMIFYLFFIYFFFGFQKGKSFAPMSPIHTRFAKGPNGRFLGCF